jgi:hypothetical protein
MPIMIGFHNADTGGINFIRKDAGTSALTVEYAEGAPTEDDSMMWNINSAGDE